MAVSIGVAVLASVLASYMSLSRPPTTPQEIADSLTGYRVAFGMATMFALLGALAAWFIRDSDAAPTMVRSTT